MTADPVKRRWAAYALLFLSVAARDASARAEPPVEGPGDVRIHALQGRGHLSPFEGTTVERVPGVVTALARDGFYLQDPEPDDDPATSEGIFVFTGARPDVVVGEAVLLTGRVGEHRASGSTTDLTVTELLPTAEVTAWIGAPGRALAPVILGATGRPVPTEIVDDDSAGSVERAASTTFDPANDGIDFYESLEGMWVRVPDARVVGPTNRYGEAWVVADGGESATGINAAFGITRSYGDENPERIQIDDALFAGPMPAFDVGTRLDAVSGVVSYAFGNFEVLLTERPVGYGGAPARPRTTLRADAARVTVASYNVENLDPGDARDGRFARIASDLVGALGSPDVVALQEVQDGSGPEDDGVTDATRTYEALVAAVLDAGGPRYAFTDVAPADGADGGEPGGNIRVGFLYRTDRVALHASARGGGGPLDAVQVLSDGGGPHLSYNPGRIAPDDSAFRACRKSVAAHFDRVGGGASFFVVNDHFGSRLGADPLFGRVQPPADPREDVRAAQAGAVARFVRELRDAAPRAKVIVVGDLNAYAGSAALEALTLGADLVDLAEVKLPPNERYGYVFEGNAQDLDHALVPDDLADVAEIEIVHVNAGYVERSSDHDPSIVRLTLEDPPAATHHRRRRRFRLAGIFALFALLFGFPPLGF